MRYKNHHYFVKRTRFYSGTKTINNIAFFIKSIIFSGVIFLIFVFGMNLIIKYFINKVDLKIPDFSFISFNTPKFIIIENKNFYAIHSSGSIKLIENNIDNLNLPILSGVSTKEENSEKIRLIKEILKLKKEFLNDISEINIKNPENIVLLTMEGKKIFVGNKINDEKLENYSLIKNRLKNMGVKYRSVCIFDEDRVIIKKEGK